LSLIRQSRGGELYDSRFGSRMRGEGPFADLLAQRFAKTIKRLGLIGGKVSIWIARPSVRQDARCH
jgi:hypothetical protein